MKLSSILLLCLGTTAFAIPTRDPARDLEADVDPTASPSSHLNDGSSLDDQTLRELEWVRSEGRPSNDANKMSVRVNALLLHYDVYDVSFFSKTFSIIERVFSGFEKKTIQGYHSGTEATEKADIVFLADTLVFTLGLNPEKTNDVALIVEQARKNLNLEYAVEGEKVHALRSLLSAFSAKDEFAMSSLRELVNHAAIRGNSEIIQMLLSRFTETFDMTRALEIVIRNNHMGALKVLMDDRRVFMAGASAQEQLVTIAALKDKTGDLIQMLLSRFSRYFDVSHALKIVVSNNNLGALKAILDDRRADMAFESVTSLVNIAASNDNGEMIRMLLARFPFIFDLSRALAIVIKKNNLAALKAILDDRRVNVDMAFALEFASKSKNSEALEAILQGPHGHDEVLALYCRALKERKTPLVDAFNCSSFDTSNYGQSK